MLWVCEVAGHLASHTVCPQTREDDIVEHVDSRRRHVEVEERGFDEPHYKPEDGNGE